MTLVDKSIESVEKVICEVIFYEDNFFLGWLEQEEDPRSNSNDD